MILGESRKILRNKVFIVMLAAIFAANIVGILFSAETKNGSYYDLKQEEQRQYMETYQNYLDQMESRGEDVLAALEDESAFLSRNVEKTVRDYRELKSAEVIIDTKYNVGVEEYAGYNYGIFFSIIFAFACLEYLYFFEKKTGSIHILRTTKNGRQQMILSKWLVYLWLVSAFALLQEIVTACLYGGIYSFGNLNASI